MKLGDFLNQDLVLDEMNATSKTDALRELVSPLAELLPQFDAEQALSVLLDRESLGTTGIGDGIAIPHGKLESLEKIMVICGRSRQGVDFESLDFKPCNIFFLVLAPEQVTGLHLRILAHISRVLKDEGFRKEFIEAADKQALWALLKSV